ncbi:hypothetical protein FBEOM_5871 [Fusarium beomiforme]|uniref:Uncharacterized protein n=1 Tax=Fusarium beomiforme TaxID=44412 RepID=A0A9P5AKH8_9HYPO|nr:hypothetical protein FBEOM_5871 [Fusarium beomiforme]
MAPEPVKQLSDILDKLQSGPQSNEGFLPTEISYATEFDFPEGIKIALNEVGGGDIDLAADIRKEFYPMAKDLQDVVHQLANNINHVDDGILAQEVNKLGASNDTAPQIRLQKSLESLTSESSSDSSSENIARALECLRLLATQVTALMLARAKLASDGGGTRFDETLKRHEILLSPPYGPCGQVLSSNLDKIIHYYEDHKYQLDVLKQAYQSELDANKELIKDHGVKDWLDWSYDYLVQNRDQQFCARCTKYVKKDMGGPAITRDRIRDNGLASYVKDVQRAQVINGQVQYPDGILSDDKYRYYIEQAFKWTWNNPEHLPCGIKIMKYATKQESVRKAMLEEADHEHWRKPRYLGFKKLCRCQQNSYAAAAQLRDAIVKVLEYVFYRLDPIIKELTCCLEDMHGNVVAGDFHSAREDCDVFLKAHNELQSWRHSYDTMFS